MILRQYLIDVVAIFVDVGHFERWRCHMKLGRSKNVILARIGRTAPEATAASTASASSATSSWCWTTASSTKSPSTRRVESGRWIGHACRSSSSGEASSAQRSVRHVVLATDSADRSVGRRRPR